MSILSEFNNLAPEIKEPIRAIISNSIGKLYKTSQDKVVSYVHKKDLSGSFRKRYADFIVDTVGKIKILDMSDYMTLDELFIQPSLNSRIDKLLYSDDGAGDSFSYGRRSYRVGRQTDTIGINAALTQSSGKLVVLGDPGAGKSTLLRAMALSCFKNSTTLDELKIDKYPIYIELRRYAEVTKKESSLVDFFHETFESSEVDKMFLDDILGGGKCIFLLDALDEVPSTQKNFVVKEIEKSILKYRDCDFVISSRIGDYAHNINSTTTYEISEFDSEKKLLFIKKWFKATKRFDLSEKLLEVVKLEGGISEITTNPLLLSLVCILFSRDLKLPNKRAELYQRCIEVLVREWDTKRGFTRETDFENLSDKAKIALLCDIAKHFYLEKKRYFKNSTLEKVVGELLSKYGINANKSPEIIQEICSHYGLLVSVGANKTGFSHLSFQEFLTAQWFVKRYKLEDLATLANKIPSSTEVYVLAAGTLDDASPLIDPIKITRELTSFRKMILISRILGSGEAIIDSTYSRSLMRYFATLLYSIVSRLEISQMREDTIRKIYENQLKIAYHKGGKSGFRIRCDRSTATQMLNLDVYMYYMRQWHMYDLRIEDFDEHMKKPTRAFLNYLISSEYHNSMPFSLADGMGVVFTEDTSR